MNSFEVLGGSMNTRAVGITEAVNLKCGAGEFADARDDVGDKFLDSGIDENFFDSPLLEVFLVPMVSS